ncbi:hypothetical protein [Rhodovulum marinum]|uniref:Uncharacterized protein n=1 Tax=Rhodovulum marinum TaxID=320662 RepID=A0A4V2SRK5_9RHOB|nr:hypothetical protein [Rhodovulum marinum]TCP43356.1 hypothetical protein EV662_102554 [Rhodovulum marinum]
MSRALSQIVAVRIALAEARKLLDNASAKIDGLQGTLRAELEEGLPTPLRTPLEDLPEPNDHVRDHRPGRPSRINTDPELRAFILARIDRMTYHALAAEVAKAFPPERRIGHSGICSWWHRHGKRKP